MTEQIWGDTSCHQCGTHDPIQVKRSRPRGRGTGRSSSIADVMRCPNCGHEWVETKTGDRTMKYSPSREAQKDLWAAHDGLIDGLTQSKPGRKNYWWGKAHRARLIDTGEYIKTSEQPRFTLTWKTVGEPGPELVSLRHSSP